MEIGDVDSAAVLRSAASELNDEEHDHLQAVVKADEPIAAPKGRGSRTSATFSPAKQPFLGDRRGGHDDDDGPLAVSHDARGGGGAAMPRCGSTSRACGGKRH